MPNYRIGYEVKEIRSIDIWAPNADLAREKFDDISEELLRAGMLGNRDINAFDIQDKDANTEPMDF